jgi:hypothetical protein
VRFQVVVYAGFAFQPLPAPASGCVPATPDNVERMAAALLALGAPAGRSDHLKGLHAALDLRPDVVLFLTDADGLPAGNLRGVLRQAAKPVALCVATVTATGVKPPMEVK